MKRKRHGVALCIAVAMMADDGRAGSRIDVNEDGFLDQADVGAVQACLTGPRDVNESGGHYSIECRACDFDDDYDVDLEDLWAIEAWTGLSVGWDIQATRSGENSQPFAVTVADVEGDGGKEIIGSIITHDLGGFVGGFTSIRKLNESTWRTIRGGYHPSGRGVVAIRWNDGEKYDVAMIGHSYSSVMVTRHGTEGNLSVWPQDTLRVPGSETRSIVGGDVDGDGDDDLVVVTRGYALTTGRWDDAGATVVFNDEGTIGRHAYYSLSSGAYGVVLADLDGDADLDIAASTPGDLTYCRLGKDCGNDEIVFLENMGGGAFVHASAVIAGRMPAGLASGDLDGDGLDDIVVALAGENSVGILLNRGGMNFEATLVAVGNFPTTVIVTDWNGDELSDLVVGNYFDRYVETLRGDGTAGFVRKGIFPTGWDGRVGWAGDANGDGITDLAFVDRRSVFTLVSK